MKIKIALTFLTFSSMVMGQAPKNKSFETLWSEFYQKSLQQKSVGLDKEASEFALSRAKKHWLPRVYVEGKWFSTNDPTQVFFTNLGQRSIQQSDFIPSDLNSPGRKSFKTATLGLDLPLYEGGMKSSQSSMFESLMKASELEVKAKKSEEYAEFSRQYGGILHHTRSDLHLTDLQQQLEKIIANYQVGSQSNLIGYSGLLGLKGVKNRIEGMLYDFNLKISHAKKWINTKTEIHENWTPNISQKLNDFLNENLTHSSTASYSSLIFAQQFKMKTLEDAKDMEKSRYLPRVGLFAQNNLYSGNRDTANAQAYGLYLMWDLFNNDSYARVSEANAKAMAAKARLEAGKQEEKIMLEQLLESKAALEKILGLIENSDNLLKEQTQNAMKLFRSGMLSALQLAEVINRRVDLIDNKSKAQTQYLDVYSRIYLLNN